MSNSVRLESEPLGLDLTLNPEQGPITESDIWDVIKHQVPQEKMYDLWGPKGAVPNEENRNIVRQAYRKGYFEDDTDVEFWKTVKDVGWSATKGVGEALGGEMIDQSKMKALLKSEGVMTRMPVAQMEAIGSLSSFHDLDIKWAMEEAIKLPVEERQAYYAKLYESKETSRGNPRDENIVKDVSNFLSGGKEASMDFSGPGRGIMPTRGDMDWYKNIAKQGVTEDGPPGMHPKVLEAIVAFSYPDQADFTKEELTGILKSGGELLRILHNQEREDDYKTDWFDQGDFGDFVMGWHRMDEDRIAKYKSRGHREHIEAIMKKHGLPVGGEGRPKDEEGDTIWESDYHMSKRNRNLYESVLRTLYTLDHHKDMATLYQGVTELVGGYRMIGNWFGAEWDQGFLDFSEKSDEDMDIELDYLYEKNSIMTKMMTGGAHMAEIVGDDRTKDFIESGDVQADADSALAIQFIADPTMWVTGGVTAVTQAGLRGVGKGLTKVPGIGNRFTMSGRITAMESAYVEALEQKTKYERMASMLFKQQAHLTNDEIASMTKVIAEGATNAEAVLMDVGEKLTKLRANYVKPPILQSFAGQGLKFTGYGADMMGRTLEVLKRMPKEMAITGLMKVGAKSAEEANVVYNAILGTGIAGGTYAVAHDGIDRSEMLIALGYFLGPKVLQEFGTGMRQVGKQLTLAEGSTGIWQNMGRLDRVNPKFSEILVDRTSGAYFGQTMRTLWGGKFFEDGAFMAMQNPSQITGRVARGIGQSGMGNVLSFGGRTTQSLATGASIPGAIGYAIGGEEGMASAIGASMPFMIAGVGVGEVVRAKNWHDINVKQRGDVANYRQQMSGMEQKLYDQMRFEHQAGLANANMLFPDLEVKLVYGKADDPGGHHTYADGRSVAEVNVNSSNPLNSIIAHEVGHHIKRHNLSAHVNEVLLGNPAKDQPGIFTAYEQKIDPQTKTPMVDAQNQPVYDFTKPIKEKINGVEYYKVNDEFQRHRKSYVGRLKGSKGVDELTIQRYERHDEVMAEEIFAEHVAHRILTGKTLENMTMGPVGRVMESMMDALGGRAFTRRVGHSVGLASDEFGTGLFAKLDESADLNNIIKKYERDTAWLNREEIRDNFPMEDDQFSGDVIINPADVKNSPLVNSLFNNGSIFKTDADGNIVTNIFGEPKRLSPSEAKAVAKKMSNELLESIENAGDVGLGHVVIDEHTLADGTISKYGSGRYLNENILNQLEASGKYNKSQIDFLRKASHAGRLDQQKQQQGLPSHVDTGNQVMMFYFSATGRGGKFYKTLRGGWRSSLIYGILVTKDSNIIIQTVSLDKLNANVDMFFNNRGYRDELVSAFGGRDLIQTRQNLMGKFEKYLENHVNGIENGKGSSGITMVQKDWLNACFGAVNKAHIRENPVLAGLGAKKAQNISVYRSRRLDRIGTMEPSGFGMSVMINKIGSNLYPRQQAEAFRPMHPGQKMFMPGETRHKEGKWYDDPYLRQGQNQLTDIVIPQITGKVSLQEFESKLSKVGGAKKYAEDISMLSEMRLEAERTGKKSWNQQELMSWAIMTEPQFRRVTYRSNQYDRADDIGADQDFQSMPHEDFYRNMEYGAYDDASYHETVVSIPRQGRRPEEPTHYMDEVFPDQATEPLASGPNQELFFYRANMAETVDGKKAYSTWDHQSDLHQAGAKRGYKALGVPHRRLKQKHKDAQIEARDARFRAGEDLVTTRSKDWRIVEDGSTPPISTGNALRMQRADLIVSATRDAKHQFYREPNMHKVGELFQEIGLYGKDPGQPPSEAFAFNDWNIHNLRREHLGHPTREALVEACKEKGFSVHYVDFIQNSFKALDAELALQRWENENLNPHVGNRPPVDNYPFKSNWQFLSVKDALGQAIKSGADVFTIPQGWVAQAMYSNRPYTKIEITTKPDPETGQPVYQANFIDETTAIDSSAMVRGVFEEKYGPEYAQKMYDEFPDGMIPMDQMPDTPLAIDLDNPDFMSQETHWLNFEGLQKELKKSVGAKEADRLLTDYTDWDMNQPARLPGEYRPPYEKNYPVTQRRNDIGVKNNYDIHSYQAMKRIAKELGIEGPYKTSLTAGNMSPFNMDGTPYNKYGPDGAYPTTLNPDLSFQSNAYALDISGLTGADMGRLKFFMPKLGKRTLGLKDNIVDIVLPSLKQDTFTREQFLARVEATGGAKQYMEELGLDTYLNTKAKFSKEDIESFVAENQVDVVPYTLEVPKHEVETLISPGLYNEPGLRYNETVYGFGGGGRFSPSEETATGRIVMPLFGEKTMALNVEANKNQNEFARVLLDDPDVALFLEENPDVRLSYLDNSFQHSSRFLGEEGQQSYVYDYQGPFNKIDTLKDIIQKKGKMVNLEDNFQEITDNASGHYRDIDEAVIWHSRTNDGEITLEDGSTIKTHHVEELQADWQKRVRKARADIARGLPVGRRFLSTEQKKEIDSLMWWAENRAQSFKDIPGAGDYVRDIKNAIAYIREYQRGANWDSADPWDMSVASDPVYDGKPFNHKDPRHVASRDLDQSWERAEESKDYAREMLIETLDDDISWIEERIKSGERLSEEELSAHDLHIAKRKILEDETEAKITEGKPGPEQRRAEFWKHQKRLIEELHEYSKQMSPGKDHPYYPNDDWSVELLFDAKAPANNVIEAPFQKSWLSQAIKAELLEASAQGADYYTWASGDIQSARYDLDRWIDKVEIENAWVLSRNREDRADGVRGAKIEVYAQGDGFHAEPHTFVIGKDGVVQSHTHRGEHISDVVGDHLAGKIMKQLEGAKDLPTLAEVGYIKVDMDYRFMDEVLHTWDKDGFLTQSNEVEGQIGWSLTGSKKLTDKLHGIIHALTTPPGDNANFKQLGKKMVLPSHHRNKSFFRDQQHFIDEVLVPHWEAGPRGGMNSDNTYNFWTDGWKRTHDWKKKFTGDELGELRAMEAEKGPYWEPGSDEFVLEWNDIVDSSGNMTLWQKEIDYKTRFRSGEGWEYRHPGDRSTDTIKTELRNHFVLDAIRKWNSNKYAEGEAIFDKYNAMKGDPFVISEEFSVIDPKQKKFYDENKPNLLNKMLKVINKNQKEMGLPEVNPAQKVNLKGGEPIWKMDMPARESIEALPLFMPSMGRSRKPQIVDSITERKATKFGKVLKHYQGEDKEVVAQARQDWMDQGFDAQNFQDFMINQGGDHPALATLTGGKWKPIELYYTGDIGIGPRPKRSIKGFLNKALAKNDTHRWTPDDTMVFSNDRDFAREVGGYEPLVMASNAKYLFNMRDPSHVQTLQKHMGQTGEMPKESSSLFAYEKELKDMGWDGYVFNEGDHEFVAILDPNKAKLIEDQVGEKSLIQWGDTKKRFSGTVSGLFGRPLPSDRIAGRSRGQQDVRYLPGVKSTETKNFKDWYGKGKFIDRMGDPIAFTHATHFDFDTFQSGKMSHGKYVGHHGIHFGNIDQANDILKIKWRDIRREEMKDPQDIKKYKEQVEQRRKELYEKQREAFREITKYKEELESKNGIIPDLEKAEFIKRRPYWGGNLNPALESGHRGGWKGDGIVPLRNGDKFYIIDSNKVDEMTWSDQWEVDAKGIGFSTLRHPGPRKGHSTKTMDGDVSDTGFRGYYLTKKDAQDALTHGWEWLSAGYSWDGAWNNMLTKYKFEPSPSEKAKIASLEAKHNKIYDDYQSAKDRWGMDARIGKYYLNIQNPLRIRDIGDWADTVNLAKEIDRSLEANGHEDSLYKEILDDPFIMNRVYEGKIFEPLQDLGYDGLIYANSVEGGSSQGPQLAFMDVWGENVQKGAFKNRPYDPNYDSVVAFEPEQVKSIWNSGSFSKDDGNVMMMPWIKMKKDQGVKYFHDPLTAIKPPVKSISHLKGKKVTMVEADRHDTRGTNMGGPMFPYLHSNQVVVQVDGQGFVPQWANLGANTVLTTRNRVALTDDGHVLVHLMGEDTHRSNKVMFGTLMSEVQGKSKHMTDDQKMVTAHMLDIIKKRNNKATALQLKPSQTKFIRNMGLVKTQRTRGRYANADALYKKYLATAKRQDWWNDQNVVKLSKDFTQAMDLTFHARAQSADLLAELEWTPNFTKLIQNNQDFLGGKNYDVTSVVQLSKHKLDSDTERVFAVYFGKDPKEAKAMSANEVKARDLLLKDPKFKPHPAYDWLMLGPENPDMFFLDKPANPVKISPLFAKEHYKNWKQDVKVMGQGLQDNFGRMVVDKEDTAPVKSKFKKFDTFKGKTPLPQQPDRNIIGAMKTKNQAMLIK